MDLLSNEQLQHHARVLAGRHKAEARRRPDFLIPRLNENESILNEAHDLLVEAVKKGDRVAPAGEWLLDNFYIVEAQIRTARLHLPPSYSRKLPRLLKGPMRDFPRVYEIALELISHVDGRVTEENLSGFVAAYQTVETLTLGELWAAPIMIRLGLIENLRRVANRLIERRRQRALANEWADRLLKAVAEDPSDIIQALAELARSKPPLESPFTEELYRRLQGRSQGMDFILSWVEHQLAQHALTREQLQQADSHVQAGDHVSIGNSINSMRLLSIMDWKEFVETLSRVEQTLRGDPSDFYARMDFKSRDHYRFQIEELAERSPLDEEAISRAALRLAAETATREGAGAPAAHVGWYLVDQGRPVLEKAVEARRSRRSFLTPGLKRLSLSIYLGLVLFLSLGAAFLLARHLSPLGPLFYFFSIFGFLAASQMAVPLVNILASAFVPPRLFPKLDFARGIPPEYRTMVVVPSLLTTPGDANRIIEDLEVRFLGNRDKNILFALLTDFCDAPWVAQPSDEELLGTVRKGIQALNEKYPLAEGQTFWLFHRPRVWNPHEKIWMGYERKRGKLEQFNALLRGGNSQAFSEIVGDLALLPAIHFVITLDNDTLLPRDAARKLIEAMAHPLNQRRFDPRMGRITGGHGILQPRTSISLLSSSRSLFARLSSGETGIDPYTTEISDIYQDLFGEGSFVGKGIYDVEAFQQATQGKFPENLILSHDLIEGCFANSALVSDVELFENQPSSFLEDASRRHRWMRGDWQIAGWLLPWTPGPAGHWIRNPLPALARWKILDNLRRSLAPIAMLALVLGGWFLEEQVFVPGMNAFVALFLGLLVFLPIVTQDLLNLASRARTTPWSQHLGQVKKSFLRHLAQGALTLVMLPFRTVMNLDAILNSGLRMLFTKRGLLIWYLPDYSRRNQSQTLAEFYREMWFPVFLGVLGLAWLAGTRPDQMVIASILPFLWILSPWMGWWISRPLARPQPELSESQRTFLLSLARKTWRFFEVFVNPDENWLPPDNFQETPAPVIASRTSPTNIGMSLLANLAAYDFGYLTEGSLLERTQKTLSTLEGLERFRGHFYNWYDTRTLKPLPPHYISSVDSGNLGGALYTLRAGLWELRDAPVASPALFKGLADTLRTVMEKGSKVEKLKKPAEELLRRLEKPGEGIFAMADLLRRLKTQSREIASLSNAEESGELHGWGQAFEKQSCEALSELQWLAPWMDLALEPNQTGAWIHSLEKIPTLRELARGRVTGRNSENPPLQAIELLQLASQRAGERLQLLEDLAQRCAELGKMDSTFMFDPACKLLSIGYNVNTRKLDKSYYDLLASEARLASFLLIAQGQLPQEHWFALGRQLTRLGGSTALVSWSGSMFEYLMPQLILPHYENTLLNETFRNVVQRQIEYGKERGAPWGISESCYNVTEANGIYQYRAFGVPGLGLKRGLGEDLVVAPYATALALMIAPREACQNLKRLSKMGLEGKYGFYEAIDFTPSRTSEEGSGVPIRNFMAHHQGMSLLSIGHLLLGAPMQRRFLSDPLFKATELLLQERVPKTGFPVEIHEEGETPMRRAGGEGELSLRVFTTPHTPIPEVHLLSNGRYHVMVTNAGGGYSRWKELAVTRWREDVTCDHWGQFCYLRDVETGKFWSASFQPTLRSPKSYEAIFLQGRAEYRRRDEEIDAFTEISVSPEDDVEVRRVTLTNLSKKTRRMELTSYAEVVIALPASDLSHPAFSNLFVQTEILKDRSAILCARRPRAPEEKQVWMFHLMTLQGEAGGETSFETDRARFIGRVRGSADPKAFDRKGPLSNTEGAVLDPIVAIRKETVILPDTSANAHFVTGMAESREEALALIGKYHDSTFAARAFKMARSHSQIILRHLQASEAEAQVYNQLAGSILYANALHRAAPRVLLRNLRHPTGLWGMGISGDHPIVLMQISNADRVDLLRQLLKAHSFWRQKGLKVDLIVLNEDFSGYRQALQDRIMGLILGSTENHLHEKPGGIYVRRSEQLSEEDRVLLQAAARAVIADSAETLAGQVERQPAPGRKVPKFFPSRQPIQEGPQAGPRRELAFFNGLGGFTADGREYVITLPPGKTTPAPWANVIANSRIGTVITECGSAYTWVDNAHEYRLTPWHNDPLRDITGEAFYLRDEETGQFWSPTPLPARGNGTYVCRHGFGYSAFEYSQFGIFSELTVFAATEAPVKVQVIKLANRSGRRRRISLTGYWELVLGESRTGNLPYIVTETDPSSGAFFARNPGALSHSPGTAFFSVSEATRGVTGNRTEFLGRNGTLANPAAMGQSQLSGKTGAGLDPCAGIQVHFDLADLEEREVVFIHGAARDSGEARQWISKFNGPHRAQRALECVWEFWKRALGAVHVETPDPALNYLVNGWLEYQILSCRFWGRSGYYQSGGAFGFRDQLQDALALIHSSPSLVREHLIRCAGRQFREGDVQHWWHPPGGQGVRTHSSDDYLWLPYATCHYAMTTGDGNALDENIPYLESRPLSQDEESFYGSPQRSGESGSLYDHCKRAIQHGLRWGGHGLPLMGRGDWNDGMNLVGRFGKGESVWLAFFLYDALQKFSRLAQKKGDEAFAEFCVAEGKKLRENIEEHGWDGAWYRRAYFDDGTPLGSATNDECKLDSIAQSWAVISGVAPMERARKAMESLDRLLVRPEQRIIQLFDPPFDKTHLQPGYIKGYAPGVRENGGQYTHAAIWAAMAFAQLGEVERAWELLAMLNPIRHTMDPRIVEIYRVEPYVMAADVYALPPHAGRGGWTWYTGSAGWMYRFIVEVLLGLQLEGDLLKFNPRLPKAWGKFKAHYRHKETFYHITFRNVEKPTEVRVLLDGEAQTKAAIPLVDDRQEHEVKVDCGPAQNLK